MLLVHVAKRLVDGRRLLDVHPQDLHALDQIVAMRRVFREQQKQKATQRQLGLPPMGNDLLGQL
jgi:hypothetical protein